MEFCYNNAYYVKGADFMAFVWCSLIGYLIGSINPAWLISKMRGFDIRDKGSKNAGASNVVILCGKMMGAVCAVLDIFKACFAIWLCTVLFPEYNHAFAAAGTACIAGHIHPLFLGFRGGKGLACLGGMIIMFSRRVFAVFLILEIVIVLVTNYICFVPITAAIAFPIAYAVLVKDGIGAAIMGVGCVMILLKHTENLSRIRNGTELRFSYLWDRESERKRLGRDEWDE